MRNALSGSLVQRTKVNISTSNMKTDTLLFNIRQEWVLKLFIIKFKHLLKRANTASTTPGICNSVNIQHKMAVINNYNTVVVKVVIVIMTLLSIVVLSNFNEA